MKEEDFDISIKVLVVGNGGVGKSSLIRRFCKDTFTDQYKKTIGVDFLEKQQFVPSIGETVTMMVWDTAGQEEFDVITKNYYRGAGAAVLAFSTTDRASFEAIQSWRDKVAAECGDDLSMVLMQNKIDLIDQAVVTSQEAEDLAKKLGLWFYRASVKDNLNIEQIFQYLAECYVKKNNQASSAPVVGTLDFSGKNSTQTTTNTNTNTNNTTDELTRASSTPSFKSQDTHQIAQKSSSTIHLQAPTKQRTGGKKRMCIV